LVDPVRMGDESEYVLKDERPTSNVQVSEDSDIEHRMGKWEGGGQELEDRRQTSDMGGLRAPRCNALRCDWSKQKKLFFVNSEGSAREIIDSTAETAPVSIISSISLESGS